MHLQQRKEKNKSGSTWGSSNKHAWWCNLSIKKKKKKPNKRRNLNIRGLWILQWSAGKQNQSFTALETELHLSVCLWGHCREFNSEAAKAMMENHSTSPKEKRKLCLPNGSIIRALSECQWMIKWSNLPCFQRKKVFGHLWCWIFPSYISVAYSAPLRLT